MLEPPLLERTASFARLCADLHSEPGGQPTLDRIAELAVQTIPGCDFCGLSLRQPDGSVKTPACTSPLAAKADALQYEHGEGPCLDAIWVLDASLIEDMQAETRWPAWAPKAAALGIRSVLSVRIGTESHTLGGLNLYSLTARAFDVTDVAIASIFARHAGSALGSQQQVNELHHALQSRQLIGVAQGMLMQRYGLSLDESFEVLRRYSQNGNVKLRVVAEELVRAGSIPEPPGAQDEDGSGLRPQSRGIQPA